MVSPSTLTTKVVYVMLPYALCIGYPIPLIQSIYPIWLHTRPNLYETQSR
jgi:hypothetical protein